MTARWAPACFIHAQTRCGPSGLRGKHLRPQKPVCAGEGPAPEMSFAFAVRHVWGAGGESASGARSRGTGAEPPPLWTMVPTSGGSRRFGRSGGVIAEARSLPNVTSLDPRSIDWSSTVCQVHRGGHRDQGTRFCGGPKKEETDRRAWSVLLSAPAWGGVPGKVPDGAAGQAQRHRSLGRD